MENYENNKGFIYERSPNINNVRGSLKRSPAEERDIIQRMLSKDPEISEKARQQSFDESNNFLFLPNEDAALELARNTPPQKRRFYYNKGRLVASELLDMNRMIELRDPEHGYFSKLLKDEKADEFIDVESEAVAIKTLQQVDSAESGEPIEIWRWSVNYLDPKDPEFKGKILNQN